MTLTLDDIDLKRLHLRPQMLVHLFLFQVTVLKLLPRPLELGDQMKGEAAKRVHLLEQVLVVHH